MAAYCRRVCVSQASFYAWRRKLQDAPNFAEVRIISESAGQSAAAGDAGALEVHLANGRRIVVRPGFDRATLLALVDTLERSIARAANGMTWNAADVADQEEGV